MKIIVTKPMGQCSGLRRILHRARHVIKTTTDQPVYIFRELVHNEHVNEELLNIGAKGVLYELDQISADSTIIVGPHSIPKALIKRFSAKARVVDTTCPTVRRVAKEAMSLSRQGYRVVFVGQRTHEEAEMVLDCVASAIVLTSENEIGLLPLDQDLGFVCQSTFSTDKYLALIAAVRATGRQVKEVMSVCTEVINRQKAAIALAKSVDKVIVVGGRHSNNTALLTLACKDLKPTWQVDTASEIHDEWFFPGETIGITAGASTPDWVVNDVLARLQTIAYKKEKAHKFNYIQNLFRIFMHKNKAWTVDTSLSIVESLDRVASKIRQFIR